MKSTVVVLVLDVSRSEYGHVCFCKQLTTHRMEISDGMKLSAHNNDGCFAFTLFDLWS